MGVEHKDYYRILGVDKRADEREIKAAFRRLARRYHPDVNPNDAAAEQRFKDISEAYEVLGDPEKRRQYDVMGPLNWMARKAGAAAQRTTTARPGQSPFDFFQNVVNAAQARRDRARRGRDLEHEVTVTLNQAYTGTKRTFSVQGEERCERCDGTGRGPNERPCPACLGKGLQPFTRNIEVSIPPGVREGSRIRLAGEGGAGTMGGPKGDLYFTVHVEEHEQFSRDGDNLETDIDVPFTILVLGGEVDVPTLGRAVRMKIPATTANSRSFRLARLGMPRLGEEVRGDLIVRVHAQLPHEVSERERRLFEELQALGSGAREDHA